MSAVSAYFTIAPQAAIHKFLVDMTLVSERSFRRWKALLVEAIDECQLSPRERASLLQFHPLEDYFFAGIVALHARAIRELYPSAIAEGLMRELATQVDATVGRSDSAVSHIVFLALNRIRKARLQHNDIAHDQVVETLLERIGVDRHRATRHLMTQMLLRQTLSEPLALASPSWWHAFRAMYAVTSPPRTQAPVDHVTVIDTSLPTVTVRHQATARTRPEIPTVDPHIVEWISSKYRPDQLGR